MNAAAPCCLAETLLLSAGINFTIALLPDERRMAHGIWGSRLLLQVSNVRTVLCHVGENKRDLCFEYLSSDEISHGISSNKKMHIALVHLTLLGICLELFRMQRLFKITGNSHKYPG